MSLFNSNNSRRSRSRLSTANDEPSESLSLWEQVDQYLQKRYSNKAEYQACLTSLKDEKEFLSFDFLYSSIILDNRSLIKKADQGKPYVVPPSEYAHTSDWKVALSGVRKFYRDGQKDIKIQKYFALPQEEKISLGSNIVLLMTAQQELVKDLTTNESRKRKRNESPEASCISTESESSSGHRENNMNVQEHEIVEFEVGDESESDEDNESIENTESIEDNESIENTESDVFQEEFDASRYHADGMGVRNASAYKKKKSAPQVAHMASSSILKQIMAMVNTQAKMVQKTPLACRDNYSLANDILIINMRNIEWTKVNGSSLGNTKMHRLKDVKWKVDVYGRSQKQIEWLIGHLHKAQCGHMYPEDDRFKGYDFNYICGESGVPDSFAKQIQIHKMNIARERGQLV